MITYFGAQVGWDRERDGLHDGSTPVHCRQCGRRYELTPDGFLDLAAPGAIDDEPDGIRAVCESCAYSTDDGRLVPDRIRSEAEYREMARARVAQSAPTTLAERKAAQLARAAGA